MQRVSTWCFSFNYDLAHTDLHDLYFFADERLSPPKLEEEEMALNRSFLAKRNEPTTGADPLVPTKKFKLALSYKASADGSIGKTIILEDDAPLLPLSWRRLFL